MAEISAAERPADVLDQYRRDAGLSHSELWLRYFGLGGMSNAMELQAFLYGALRPRAHDREVIAQALNERFVELGGNHPVPYSEGDADGTSEKKMTSEITRRDPHGVLRHNGTYVHREGNGVNMTEDEAGPDPVASGEGPAKWSVTDWRGKLLVDRNGEKIGKLQDVYVDVETDEPQFGTVKEGFIGRHLTFVPLGGLQIGPDDLQVTATKDQVRSAPDIELHGEELSQADESALYHHFEMNYTPINTESGRRLARR